MLFRRWKSRLQSHGLDVVNQGERLTNTRYADDVLLYARSLHEVQEMLSILHDELAKVGLQMHGEKTKVLTTTPSDTSTYLVVGDMRIEVLPSSACHKYLGR